MRIDVRTDEWTDSVTGYAGSVRLDFTRVADSKDLWRSDELALVLGENEVRVKAKNRASLERESKLTIRCSAARPRITAVTWRDGTRVRTARNGETYFVRDAVELEVTNDAGGATLLVAGQPIDGNTVKPRLTDGQPARIEFVARRGKIDSTPFGATFVLDQASPTLTAEPLAPAAAGSVVTLRGTWQDNLGIASIELAAGPGRGSAKADLVRDAETRGTWKLSLRARSRAETLTLIARDRAGNTQQTTVELEIAASQSPSGSDGKSDPPPKTTPTPRTFPGFARLPGCDLNDDGYPRELRHVETGIELLAIEFGKNGRPDLYVAKSVTTERQWSGANGEGAKRNLTWREVATKLREPRFKGLTLPSKREWPDIWRAIEQGRLRGKLRAWLAPDANDSLTDRPLGNGAQISVQRPTYSDKYTAFRAVFRPK